jgi:hypothetical protein
MRLQAFALVLLMGLVTSCTQDRSATPTPLPDPRGLVTVVLDPNAPGTDEVGVMRLEGVSTGFMLDQIIVDLGSNEARWEEKLESVLAAYEAVLLDDFGIPDPPLGIPEDETRLVLPSPYRLIGLTPLPADMNDLTYRLERASYRGEVAFSSQAAADLVNVQLALDANEHGLDVRAELNALGCPLEPWTADFEFYKTNVTAPGTAELVVYTPDTAGLCGPGFSVEGVRFYADGAPLGEGVPYRWWDSGAPERLRYLWQLVPGEDGVPEAGSANISLSAELVVRDDEGEVQIVEVYGTPQLEVTIRGAPVATEAQRLAGTVAGWPGVEGVVTAYMNQGFDFQAAIAIGTIDAQGDLELTLPAVLDKEWYGYEPFLPVTECPDAGATIGTLEAVMGIDVTDPRPPPEGPQQLGFLAEGASAAAVRNLLEADVGEFVIVRAFAPEAFVYQAECSWLGFEGQQHVATYDVEVVAGWNAFTVRLERRDAAVKGWRITSSLQPPEEAQWLFRPLVVLAD